MTKGKFGFSLWLYPFISLWTVLVGPSLASFLITGFVIATEKDEWTIQQCFHVVMFNVYWNVYKTVMGFLSGIPLLGLVIGVIDGIVFVVMLVLILFLGLSRLKNGQDIGLPGKRIVLRAYGLYQTIQYQQAPPQYQQPQQYQQAQQQPVYQQQPPAYAQPPQYQEAAPAPPPYAHGTQSELKPPPPPPEI